MHFAGALHWAAKTNNGFNCYNRRTFCFLLGSADSLLNGRHIITIFYGLRMPAISVKALHRIFGISKAGGAIQGNMVIVVEVISFPSFRWPAREAASEATPSIKSPSLTMP